MASILFARLIEYEETHKYIYIYIYIYTCKWMVLVVLRCMDNADFEKKELNGNIK